MASVKNKPYTLLINSNISNMRWTDKLLLQSKIWNISLTSSWYIIALLTRTEFQMIFSDSNDFDIWYGQRNLMRMSYLKMHHSFSENERNVLQRKFLVILKYYFDKIILKLKTISSDQNKIWTQSNCNYYLLR